MDEFEYESIIYWFGHYYYYNEMLHHAREATEMYPESESLKILLALSLSLTGQSREALQEISELVHKNDCVLSVASIQNYVYKSNEIVNRVMIEETELRIKERRRQASPLELTLAAMILLLLKQCDRAKEYIDKAYKNDSTSIRICIVKGWSEINTWKSKRGTEKLVDYFENVLKDNTKNFGALLGTAMCKKCLGEHLEAISVLNTLIVRYSRLCIPLVEKMLNQLALKDWDMVLETANRISSIENNNLDALKASVIVSICRDGDFVKGIQLLKQLFKSMFHNESRNTSLIIDNVQLFSRITNENKNLLMELLNLIEKVVQQYHQNKVKNSALLIEYGNICLKMGNVKEAENWYRNTVQIDESSFQALIGLAQCQLLDTSPGATEVAQQQVDLLMEIQQTGPVIAPEILYMSAKLTKKRDPNKAIHYLEKACVTIQRCCNNIPYGYEYLIELNPDLCTKIVSEYLLHLPSYHFLNTTHEEESIKGTVTKAMSNACLDIMKSLSEACPGFSNVLLMLSKIKMQLGDIEGAQVSLKKLLDVVDPTNASGYLLMAQILAHQGQYHLVSQTLEVGVSYNFKVRDDPMYHTITGILAKENGDYEGCIQHLKTAMSSTRYVDDLERNDTNKMSTSEKATLYLELISACSKLKKFDDALMLMEEAKTELVNTIEEGRVIMGNAELALEMADVDKAIFYLSEVTPNAPYYLQAHKKLADIYLKHKKDQQKFAQCHRELVENCPGPRTYIMLGDAYIAIQEPERAIEAYEYSLQKNANDKVLSRKMGKALIKTHQYKKAIEYYKEAIQYENSKELKLDLAELYMKMKQFDNAESILLEDLKDSQELIDPTSFDIRSKQLRMLAKIREKSGNIKAALGTLKEAKDTLVKSTQRLSTSLTSLEQKHKIAQLCLEAAEYASILRDYDQAVMYYKEALNYTPTDIKTLLSLAKLYLQMNNLEKCTQSCTTVLNTDPKNEAASVMMADLAFRKVDFETAAYHFRQILLQRPTYWTALARLIEVSRRMSCMEELEDWLLRAKEAVRHSKDKAGYHYCAGLLDWRIGKVNSALRHFNAARRDPEWGQQAVYNMIEICLDPDDDSILSSEVFNDEDAEYQDTRTIALKTVQRLLQELNPKGSPHEVLTRRLLGNFYLLATKQKGNIEKALQDCTTLASQEALKDHVGPALGLAMAHILLKQTPRARNHLKRVSKNIWTFEDAEYLERCWLLLANIYMQSSKYDLANELLRRVLKYNATCVKAHELAAQIAEKEQNYSEAAIHYSQAWKFGGKSKLFVGYKLAYCYFKSKSYADAIEISYEVLKQNPDYPRIRKEILEKSINSLRT